MSIIHFESEIDYDQATAALTEACAEGWLDFSLSRIKGSFRPAFWVVGLWSLDGDDTGLFRRHRAPHLFLAVNSAVIAVNQFRQQRRFNEIILEQIGRIARSSSSNPLFHASTGPTGQEVKAA
jgi:hypothetical protein